MADQGWTARRRRTLERYVADLAPRMRLADWTITVLWEEASGASAKALPDDALATITPQPSSKHACIRVSPLLLTLTPTEQTQALVHELVHCHLFALVESAQTTFSLLGKRERKAAELGPRFVEAITASGV